MRTIVLACVLALAACGGGRDPDEIDDLIGNECVEDRECVDRCFIDAVCFGT